MDEHVLEALMRPMPLDIFEHPLPRRSDGEIDIYECVWSWGPLKGKKFRYCTQRDFDRMRRFADELVRWLAMHEGTISNHPH